MDESKDASKDEWCDLNENRHESKDESKHERGDLNENQDENEDKNLDQNKNNDWIESIREETERIEKKDGKELFEWMKQRIQEMEEEEELYGEEVEDEEEIGEDEELEVQEEVEEEEENEELELEDFEALEKDPQLMQYIKQAKRELYGEELEDDHHLMQWIKQAKAQQELYEEEETEGAELEEEMEDDSEEEESVEDDEQDAANETTFEKIIRGGLVHLNKDEVGKLKLIGQLFFCEDSLTHERFLFRIVACPEESTYCVEGGRQWKGYVEKFNLKDGDKLQFTILARKYRRISLTRRQQGAAEDEKEGAAEDEKDAAEDEKEGAAEDENEAAGASVPEEEDAAGAPVHKI